MSIIGFSKKDRKVFVYDTKGKQLIALELPMELKEPTYAGCVGAIVAFTQPEGKKTTVFWRRLRK